MLLPCFPERGASRGSAVDLLVIGLSVSARRGALRRNGSRGEGPHCSASSAAAMLQGAGKTLLLRKL